MTGADEAETSAPSSALDYAEEGWKLLLRLRKEGPSSQYSPCDPVWRHPQTGATLLIGDMMMARSRKLLQRHAVARVVNCQDSDGENYFEGDPDLSYLNFTVGLWRRRAGVLDGGEGTWSYFQPCISFVVTGLEQGDNVFVHCLAGAHRAGTVAIAMLMVLCNWGWRQATFAAKQLRPAIDPIGDFPQLLAAFDTARVGRASSIKDVVPDDTNVESTIPMPIKCIKGAREEAIIAPHAATTKLKEEIKEVTLEMQAREALDDYAQRLDAGQEVVTTAYVHIEAGRHQKALQVLAVAGAFTAQADEVPVRADKVAVRTEMPEGRAQKLLDHYAERLDAEQTVINAAYRYIAEGQHERAVQVINSAYRYIAEGQHERAVQVLVDEGAALPQSRPEEGIVKASSMKNVTLPAGALPLRHLKTETQVIQNPRGAPGCFRIFLDYLGC